MIILPFMLRRTIAPVLRWFSPGFGYCRRCGLPWRPWLLSLGPMHFTQFTASHICAPLCKACWRELGTPIARLPYYAMLIADWDELPPITDNATRMAIYLAVRRGN